tara:strand:+ start:472 stop:645 length:174 start_codon:yes stop_codon:yes gene_type:complete
LSLSASRLAALQAAALRQPLVAAAQAREAPEAEVPEVARAAAEPGEELVAEVSSSSV